MILLLGAYDPEAISDRQARRGFISGCHVQISEPGRQDISRWRDSIAPLPQADPVAAGRT
jgi:hypothetical protein